MFNVGGGELLVIFLVALIVLGPAKLPDVARQIGGVMREIRRVSSGFQEEMRAAMDEPVEAAARERGNRVVATSEAPAPGVDRAARNEGDPPDDGDAPDAGDPSDAVPGASADSNPETTAMSTAAAAGMYDVAADPQRSTPNPYLAPVGTRAQPPEPAAEDTAEEPDAEPPHTTEDPVAAGEREDDTEPVEPATDEPR